MLRDIINWWRYDLQFTALSFKQKVTAYVWVFVLTFGYTCATQPELAANGNDITGFVSFFKALCWPLFWSYQVFDWLLN